MNVMYILFEHLSAEDFHPNYFFPSTIFYGKLTIFNGNLNIFKIILTYFQIFITIFKGHLKKLINYISNIF